MITRIRLDLRHMSRSADPGPPKEPPPPTPPPPPSWRRWLLPVGLLILLGILFWPSLLRGSAPPQYSFTTFENKVTSGVVKSVEIDNNGGVTGVLTDGKSFTSQIPTALDTARITQELQAANVQVTGKQAGGSWLVTWLPSLIWLLLIVGLFVWTGRQAQRSLAGGIGGFSPPPGRRAPGRGPPTRGPPMGRPCAGQSAGPRGRPCIPAPPHVPRGRPPSPPAGWKVTAREKLVAATASKAFPPARNASYPARDARTCSLATALDSNTAVLLRVTFQRPSPTTNK